MLFSLFNGLITLFRVILYANIVNIALRYWSVQSPTTWDGVHELWKKRRIIPSISPSYDTEEIIPFAVAYERSSVFGLAHKDHKAVQKSCLLFRKLTFVSFASLNLSLNAFFSNEGTFRLYDHIAADQPTVSNPVLEEFLKLYTKQNVVEDATDTTASKQSFRRLIWNKLIKDSPKAMTEELLDSAISKIHYNLDSVKLVSDSKQVTAMQMGVEARQKETKARRFGSVSLAVGGVGVVLVGTVTAAAIAAPLLGAAAIGASTIGGAVLLTTTKGVHTGCR